LRFSRLITEAADAIKTAATSTADAVSGADVVSGSTVSPSDTLTSISDVVSGADISVAGGIPVSTIITVSIIVFALIMIGFEIIRSRYVLSVTRKTVVLDELPEAFDGTRIAVISDLHQMRFGDFNEELAKHIRREFPDYVFFAGDMGDAEKFNVDAFYDFLDSLGSDIPLIMVPGRDDLRIGGGTVHRNFAREVEYAGALLLHNTCAELLSDKSKLYVYGFCPPLEPQEDVAAVNWDYAEVSEDDLPNMLGRCPTDAPVLLLAHDPKNFEAYSKWGAQLVISGFMHGGLVRIPHFGGIFSIDGGKLFPKYTGGEYELDDSRMIVNRGLGSPNGLRFFNAPEITLITLSLPEDRKPVPEPEAEEIAEPVIETVEAALPLKERIKKQIGFISDWFKSENRSLRELLYERSIQIRDFFSLMTGKKRDRFAKVADEKKRKNTYVAPKKPKKKLPDRSKGAAEHYKRKGQFTVKPTQRIRDENESFGTNYDAEMRTDLDDERSELFRRTDRDSRKKSK